MLYSSLLGLSLPFTAVHLLLINLLTDFLSAAALGLESYADAVMRKILAR